MKSSLEKRLLLLAMFFFPLLASSQVKYMSNLRTDGGIAYNFFTGPDAADFRTSINGFGSGFLFDIFTGRYSLDLITVGSETANLSLGVGLAINKYRFADNLVIGNENDQIVYEEDPDPNHDYVNTFFGYGKSKLVYSSVYFPLNLDVSLGPMHFSAGGFIDLYLSGKLKRKFKAEGEKEVVLVKNEEFRDYPLNHTKYGVNALLMHKKSGVGMGFTYMITPFFQEDHGPVMNETRISFVYKFSKFD